MSDFVDIEPRLSSSDAIIPLLKRLEKEGGSDLILYGGIEAIADIYGKKVKLTSRILSEAEIITVLRDIYGDNAEAKLGTATPIDTSFEFKAQMKSGIKKRFRYRVNATPCLRNSRESITVTMRSIPTTPPTAEELGLEREIFDAFQKTRQGLIMVVGGTGNGKSTLLAANMRSLLEADTDHNIITIESPIEFVYDDIDKVSSQVTQSEVGRHISSFGAGVVNSLRMAPTAILVGESRDYETIRSSIEASSTGHAVYTTVHANSVSETFQRMTDVFPPELQSSGKQNLLQSVKMIVAQMLVPSTDGKRIALREYLIFDQADKNMLSKSLTFIEDIDILVKKKGQPMLRSAEKAFNDQLISEEVLEMVRFNF